VGATRQKAAAGGSLGSYDEHGGCKGAHEMTWLVTGGAGYIGAHVVRAFGEAGLPAVVVDDLSSGHRDFVPDDVPFVEGTILDTPLLVATMREHQVTGVVHVAGFKYAGVSVQRPLHTYEQNVEGTISVLRATAEAEVDAVVFSSSAATYGTPDVDVVTEQTPTAPESPYGESKLIGEWLLRDQATATGLRHTSLRYFNVVGSGTPELYDSSPHNLFPLVLEALLEGRTPAIYGDDYPTPDGTCVRDYVHVADLAVSHVSAARALAHRTHLEPVYNLGSGDGLSVRAIMDAMARVTGVDFEPDVRPRRPGDPARIVASGALAARDLDWVMRHDLDEMVRSAWEARRAAGERDDR
jgi:UDP-glucose 4-epimerase